jgi:hypothetical protein
MKYKEELYSWSAVFTQEADSCDEGGPVQALELKADDAGGGKFLVIKTERWSIDVEDIDGFCQRLKSFINGKV